MKKCKTKNCEARMSGGHGLPDYCPKCQEKRERAGTPAVAVQRVVSGRGYAWMMGDGSLCHWVAPDVTELVRDGKPSPEAKHVAVRIITEKTYRMLIAR